jgi:arylsulfatase A
MKKTERQKSESMSLRPGAGKLRNRIYPVRLERTLVSVLLLAVLFGGCSDKPEEERAESALNRPNILLIMIDDLGYEAIGAYGGISYATPNIDRLAESGVRFNHAYSTPLCSPSRVQLMTGRYNNRNYDEWAVLEPDEISFGNLLQDAGYATFVAGKWQLWGHDLLWPVEVPCCLHQGQTPTDAGFDDYLVWFLGNKGSRYADPQLSMHVDDDSIYADSYGPDLLAGFISGAIETHVAQSPEQPFFGYYPMVLDHSPFEPTPDSASWNDDRHARDRANFPDMVNYADKLVGQLIHKLEELGIRDNTLVLLTADNGTPRGIESRMQDGRTIIGDKGRPTDGGTHVPFIASWPGTIDGNRVSDALVDFTDFLPSLVDAAGAQLPDDRVIDGLSFIPILRGDVAKTRDWVFTDYRPNFRLGEDGEPIFPPISYVQDQRFKLYEDGRFFDLENDILEEKPLETAAADALAAKAALQAVLDTML